MTKVVSSFLERTPGFHGLRQLLLVNRWGTGAPGVGEDVRDLHVCSVGGNC